jgi:hypothetical protein
MHTDAEWRSLLGPAAYASAVVALAKILREAGYQDVGSGTVSVSGTGGRGRYIRFPDSGAPAYSFTVR